MWLISLVGVIERNVPPFAGTDADGVLYRDDEDAPVAYLARLGGFQYRLDGFLYILFAHHDGEQDALYRACVVHHAAVNAAFAVFPTPRTS